jgi:hypothetical protein
MNADAGVDEMGSGGGASEAELDRCAQWRTFGGGWTRDPTEQCSSEEQLRGCAPLNQLELVLLESRVGCGEECGDECGGGESDESDGSMPDLVD